MTAKPGKYGIEGLFNLHWLREGYRKTLEGLQGKPHALMTVAADHDALQFTDYPFAPASVYPQGRVAAAAIDEINFHFPSQVRLKNGEMLFVSNASKEALLTLINQAGIKVQRRISVWSALLDPFLDTWQEQSSIDKQFEWFAKQGLDRKTVDGWREEVADAMIAYNFGTMLWEWSGFSLYDVLLAQQARLSQDDFTAFYQRAMALNQFDPILESDSPISDTTISSALHSVLLDWLPRQTFNPDNFSADYDRRSAQVKTLQIQLANELTVAYSQPHRRYHTIEHVEHCLREASAVWLYAVNLNEIRWALLFHDAIYDPQRHDNEARSANWACEVMQDLQRPREQIDRVRAMILATAHATPATTPDAALLLDIDLSILGASEAAFDRYDQAIREEYSWVPDEAYRNARGKVLESFANRTPIYQTAIGRTRYESQARANLERALARLQP